MKILGDYIDILSGFAFKTKDFAVNGVPIIKIKNISPPTVSLDDLTYVSKEVAEKQNRFILSYDDVLIAMTGSHINQWASVVGRVARVKYLEKTLLNQRVGKVAIKKNAEADIDYVYYYLSQDAVKIELAAKAGGAANQANISPSHIKNLQFPCPSLDTQNRIANILSAYDDLIENNQKQIKLLEEAAQRLYKEWFVDLHFPGYEDTEIIDGVPEGWETASLSSVSVLKAGGDKPKVCSENKTDECQVPIFSNGISNKGLYGYTNKAVVEKESVTISARGTVGFVFLHRTPFVPIVRLISVTPKDDVMDVLYLYLNLSNQNFRATGAAQQQITVPLLKDKTILCPSVEVRKDFNDNMLPIFNQIDTLEKRMLFAQQARDRLLPKLMSGELEV